MPRYIIKADKDRDLYMEWSTVVDAPTFIGTRAEVLQHLTPCAYAGGGDVPQARVKRADDTGTSAYPSKFGPADGAWDDAGLIVEQRGWLPRDKFAEFLDSYDSDPGPDYGLLEAFNDAD